MTFTQLTLKQVGDFFQIFVAYPEKLNFTDDEVWKTKNVMNLALLEITLHDNAMHKGQLISKCLFGVFNSPKKRTKTIRLEVP